MTGGDQKMTLDLTGTCVLVVEDEAIIALDLKLTLEDLGAEVLGPARTLREAMNLSKNGHISLAILDRYLNDSIIDCVADRLSDRNVPLIFHTGNSEEAALMSKWPGAEILSKPADPAILMSMISTMLGKN
jgi:DNA-binding response OmpR family regulator